MSVLHVAALLLAPFKSDCGFVVVAGTLTQARTNTHRHTYARAYLSRRPAGTRAHLHAPDEEMGRCSDKLQQKLSGSWREREGLMMNC